MKFTKMEGAGNDYVYINLFDERVPDAPDLARRMSNRNFGVGSDGLILIAPSNVADVQMIMYNADGSRSEMCGNGVRCVAKYAYDSGICRKKTIRVETGAGVLPIDVHVDKNDLVVKATVNMGKPILNGPDIPTTWTLNPVVAQPLQVLDREFSVTCVSMGNPHCVTFVEDALNFDLHRYGPVAEHHERFPNRVNFEIVQIVSPTEVIQRTWERGTGETLACGTGASAVCAAAVLNELTERKILIHLPGGDLELFWNDEDGCIYKTGPAREVFSGEWLDD